MSSGRKPRTDAVERRRAIVQNLAANLAILAIRYPLGHRLAVQAYKQAKTRYDRPDFPRGLLMEIIGEMEAAGWIIRYPGVSRKLRTTLVPTSRFLDMIRASRISSDDIDRVPGGETIALKAVVGRNRPKLLINFEDTPETRQLRSEMEKVNAAINAADVRLDGRPQPPTHMVRVFLIDGPEAPHVFTKHGRLFRGFWEHLQRERRGGLTIGGEPLVELDYRAMYLHLAYASQGVPVPAGDPYAIPGLEGYRGGAKKAVSALFFRDGPMLRLTGELRDMLPEGWTAQRLQEAVAAHHPALVPVLNANIGPTLANTESRILVAVLLRLLDEGIVALPIHDCLLVPVGVKDAALMAMREESARIVGVAIPVGEKPTA
ncbi:hypothetical protein ASC75_05055 [Aminobacter sp. DSM 101952]|uniref:hypothetical protein n=1 Tax=Aminobacter sp. DSM 101952 TaxID=2735891 RepID=UPI0006F56CA6|nr:hypothetical protein [Aminobacter sp. DSM 101952]KQU73030.1 hypothetical protein ASC75_05055 [Aminobacter sp. DSM 101952]